MYLCLQTYDSTCFSLSKRNFKKTKKGENIIEPISQGVIDYSFDNTAMGRRHKRLFSATTSTTPYCHWKSD